MLRATITAFFFTASIVTASAQGIPSDPPPVTISGHLAQALIAHLTQGGTISAGQELAREIYDSAARQEQKPQAETKKGN